MLRFASARVAETVAGLAARALRVLHSAWRPSGVAGGFIADLTRSRAELISENALLRQPLIVASRGVKRPSFRHDERGMLVLRARRCTNPYFQNFLKKGHAIADRSSCVSLL